MYLSLGFKVLLDESLLLNARSSPRLFMAKSCLPSLQVASYIHNIHYIHTLHTYIRNYSLVFNLSYIRNYSYTLYNLQV